MSESTAVTAAEVSELVRQVRQLVLIGRRLVPERTPRNRTKPKLKNRSASEFRTTPCTMAIAILLSGESRYSTIADLVGVHRGSLTTSEHFRPFREAVEVLRQMREFGRVDGSSTLD